MILTLSLFHRTREKFWTEVGKSPETVDFLEVSTSAPDDPMKVFTGDSVRTEVSNTFKCLYRRKFTPAQRTKFGLKSDISCVVFVSPKDIEKVYGSYKVDEKKFVFVFQDVRYVVDNFIYQAEQFGNCVAIEIRLKEEKYGG